MRGRNHRRPWLRAGARSQRTDAGAIGRPSVVSADGNGVNQEQTSADLASNGLLYEDLTAIAAQRNQIMSTAIGTPS